MPRQSRSRARWNQACSTPDALPASLLHGHSMPVRDQWRLSASSRLSFRDRNGEVEGSAFSEFTIEPDPTALHFHQALGDVQPQTCPGCLTRFRVIRTDELLEDLPLIFDVDADPIVLDLDVDDLFGAFWIPLFARGFRA